LSEALTARTDGGATIRSAVRLGWEDLLVDEDDPEKRTADLEHHLAGQKRDADLGPAHHDAAMAYPSQTPGYGRSGQNNVLAIA